MLDIALTSLQVNKTGYHQLILICLGGSIAANQVAVRLSVLAPMG